MDDAQLLAATAGGDAEAFAALYRRHLPRVVGIALRATGDPELAADLAGEVFAVALASAARYELIHDTAAALAGGDRQQQAAREPPPGARGGRHATTAANRAADPRR